MSCVLPGRCATVVLLGALGAVVPVTHAAGAALAGTVRARAAVVARRVRAFGEVQPVATTIARAVAPGTVQRIVLPGARVRRGQVLAVIAGPQAEALLARRRGALRAARARLQADRRQFAAQLVTRQTLTAEQAAQASARAALQAALRALTVRAPVTGRVQAVAVSRGAQVIAGQPLLWLQSGRLWLQAKFYGRAASSLHPGMRGGFRPASGGPDIAVRIATVAAALGRDDGERVLLRPVRAGAAPSAWRNGAWGTVIIDGGPRRLVAVPSRALILDRARWWVLVRTATGFRRQRVVPGPSRGWLTYLESGIRPGQRVLVRNADLEFHHGIASRYTPPN